MEHTLVTELDCFFFTLSIELIARVRSTRDLPVFTGRVEQSAENVKAISDRKVSGNLRPGWFCRRRTGRWWDGGGHLGRFGSFGGFLYVAVAGLDCGAGLDRVAPPWII